MRREGGRPLRHRLASYLERIRSGDPSCVEIELACERGDEQDGLTDEHVGQLAAALGSNRFTRSLNAWGNPGITDVGAEALIRLLSDNSVLDRVNLDITSVTDATRARLQRMLLQRCLQAVSDENPDQPQVRSLDLSRRNLVDSDIEKVANVLRGNPFISSLALWGNPRVTDAGLQHVLDVLHEKEWLVSLNVEGTSASDAMQKELASRINQSRFYKALCAAPDPRTSVLNLSNAALTDAGLKELADAMRGNRSITSLLLNGNPDLTDKSTQHLLTCLEEVPYLTSLALDTRSAQFSDSKRNQIRKWKIDRMIQAMQSNAATCTKIDFSSCPLRDSEWGAVMHAIRRNSTVVSLNLGASRLSEASVRRLLEIIPSHASLARIVTDRMESTDGWLKVVNHDHGGEVSTDLRNEILEALRDRILERARHSLRQGLIQHLEDLQYIDITDGDLKALAPAVAQSTSLTALSLRCGSSVSKAGVIALLGDSRREGYNSRLTRLILVHTPQSAITLPERDQLRKLMATRAIAQAAHVIEANLQHSLIDLSQQWIEDDDVLCLCDCIRKRSHISTLELDFSDTSITNRGALALEELLESEKFILRINLRGSAATPSVRERIADKLRIRAIGHACRTLSSSIHPPLIRRCISIDYLQDQHLRDDDIAQLAACIRKGDMIEAINLNQNSALSDKAGQHLLEVVKSRKTAIHTLHLHGTGISSRVVQAIQNQLGRNAFQIGMEALEANSPHLVSVTCLRNRGLLDDDAAKIARTLVRTLTVQDLDLSGNPEISDASVRAFEAALTNRDYSGTLRKINLDGTRCSATCVQTLLELLQSRRKPKLTTKKNENDEGVEAGEVLSGEKGNSAWSSIFAGIENVKRLISDSVSSLELERDGVSSSTVLEMPFLAPLVIDPSRCKSLAHDILIPTDISRSTEKKGIMQFKSIGARLKFVRSDVKLTDDGLASNLAVPRHSIRIYRHRFDPCLFDVRLYDVSLNTDPSYVHESCEEVAARLFTFCQDVKSLLCRQYNDGKEVFCHYPWALPEDQDYPIMVAGSESGSSLAECIPHVMSMSRTEWNAKLQKVFAQACHELSSALSDKFFKSSHIKRVCEQFAAQALMQLEKAAQNSASLQRVVSPDEQHSRLEGERKQGKDVCQAFMKFVRWIADGGEAVPPLSDPEVEAAVTTQWSNILKRFSDLKREQESIQGKRSSADPSFLDYLESQAKQGRDTARKLIKRCDESLVQVGQDLTDLRAEKLKRQEDIKVATVQIRQKREKIQQQLEQTIAKRNQDLIQIQQFLKSYTENSRRVLALSRQDDALARAERNIEHDPSLVDIQKQIAGLEATQQDWKAGKNVASQLEVSIHSVSSEMRHLIEFEHLRLDHGVRDLSLRLFKQNFFPVYVLSQLEIERLKYSIAIDRTEADRTKSWSGIYHPVGKLRKPMIAYNTWTNGSANQPTLLDPSPFTAGSNSHTKNVWGASYDRQRKDMAILAQLVLNLTFESIDDMESFRLDLRADISSAIGCSVDAVQVHSVVAGSVVATISLLSDTNPTHGDRSPSDLMKELVKQSVDSSSSLRSGKYTMHMTELKQVPNSIADQSVQDQELRAASISDVLQRIENQSGPLWDAMRQAKSAVTICAGTDKEVIVIRDGDSQVCIPSYRLLTPAISYEGLIDQGRINWDSDFLVRYLESAEKQMRSACAASKAFSVEYKNASISSKRAQDVVNRQRASQSKVSSFAHKADREYQRAVEKVADATANLDRLILEMEEAEYFLKLAAEDVLKARKILDQRTAEWHASADELVDVKCLQCRTTTQMTAPYAEARIKKSQQLAQASSEGLYFFMWKQAICELKIERTHAQISPARQSVHDSERKLKVAQSEMENAHIDLENVELSLEKEKAAATRAMHVLQAYQYVSESAPPDEEIDKSYLIKTAHLIYRTCLRMTVAAHFEEVSKTKESLAKFTATVEQGLVNLIMGSSTDKDLRRDVQTRLENVDVGEALTGKTLLTFNLVRDNPDFSSRFDQVIEHLRHAIMPTNVGTLPVQLQTGIGSTGSSIVEKLEILDPVGHGQFGQVRQAKYDGARVAAKEMKFEGAKLHEARVRADRLGGELASQVSALCLASHPNILRVHGVFFEKSDGLESGGAPICGLVQEYANENLFDFIAHHNAPHSEVHLNGSELHGIFEALDTQHTGRVTHSAWIAGLAKKPWIADKLKVPGTVRKMESLASPPTLQYVWNYGTNDGNILDPPAEYHHPFGWLDRQGVGSFSLDDFILYFGPRELPEGRLAWPHRIAIVVAIATGMHYLLEHGLTHGNLKSANVALANTKTGQASSGTWMLSRIAVMDYGMPYLRRGFTLMPASELTTPAWQAPERLQNPGLITSQGDVWSFGVIMWEILTGEVPWPGKSLHDLRQLAQTGTLQLPVLPKHHDSAPANYIKIMLQCMDQESKRRPTFHAVCELIEKSKVHWAAEFLPG